jgi:hypothetical protein
MRQERFGWFFSCACAALLAATSAAAQQEEEPEVIGPSGPATGTTTQPEDTTTTQPGWGTQPSGTTTQPGWGTQPSGTTTQPGWGTQPPGATTQPGWDEQDDEEGVTLVESRYGSISLGLILQARFRMTHISRSDYTGYLWGPEAPPTAGDDDTELHFEMQRARVIFLGHLVSPKLKYFLEMDVYSGFADLYSGLSTFGDDATPGFMQQMKVGYQLGDSEAFTSDIWVGMMRPPFGLLLERPVHRLGAIEYPLYMMEGSGHFPLSPWTEVGLLWDAYFKEMFRLCVGVFNGPMVAPTDSDGDGVNDTYTRNLNPFQDVNLHKDFLVKFAYVRQEMGLQVGLNMWLGFPPSQNASTLDPAKTYADTAFVMGLEGGWEDKGFNIMGEFLVGLLKVADGDVEVPRPVEPSTEYSEDLATSLAFWVHFGYTIKELVEVMVRLDFYDAVLNEQLGTGISFLPFPDDVATGRDDVNDWRMRLTVGPQLHLEKLHSVVSVNYLLDILHMNDNTVAAPDNPLETSVNVFAHSLMIQASVALW